MTTEEQLALDEQAKHWQFTIDVEFRKHIFPGRCKEMRHDLIHVPRTRRRTLDPRTHGTLSWHFGRGCMLNQEIS